MLSLLMKRKDNSKKKLNTNGYNITLILVITVIMYYVIIVERLMGKKVDSVINHMIHALYLRNFHLPKTRDLSHILINYKNILINSISKKHSIIHNLSIN